MGDSWHRILTKNEISLRKILYLSFPEYIWTPLKFAVGDLFSKVCWDIDLKSGRNGGLDEAANDGVHLGQDDLVVTVNMIKILIGRKYINYTYIICNICVKSKLKVGRLNQQPQLNIQNISKPQFSIPIICLSFQK